MICLSPFLPMWGFGLGVDLDAALTLGVPMFPPRLLEHFRG